MRSQEFINEDGFTPAQQAAQRAGMGTTAWVKGSPPPSMGKAAWSLGKKAIPLVGTLITNYTLL